MSVFLAGSCSKTIMEDKGHHVHRIWHSDEISQEGPNSYGKKFANISFLIN